MIDKKEHSELIQEGIRNYRKGKNLPNDELVHDGECRVVYGQNECSQRQEGGMCPHLIGQISCLPYCNDRKNK